MKKTSEQNNLSGEENTPEIPDAKNDLKSKNISETKNSSEESTKLKSENNNEEKKSPENFKEIIKEGSSLNLLKIVATALTAVSMALISANLAGVVNSLMLVAILSIGTAVVSEFYRVILSVTSLGAKKVVKPVIQTTMVKNKDGSISEVTTTQETPILTTDIEELEENAQDFEKLEELEEKVEESGHGKIKLFFVKFKIAAKHYYKNNPFIRFILLFAGIALLTIGTSYFVSEGNQNSENIFTTIYKTESQKETLSENEKQEIIDDAVTEAKESIPPTTVVEKETETVTQEKTVEVPVEEESADNEEGAVNSNRGNDRAPLDNQTTTNNNNQNETQPSTSTQNPANENNNNNSTVSDDDIQTLIERIEQLENDNKILQDELNTLNDSNAANNNDSSSMTKEELEEALANLQKQIDDLNSSNTGNETNQSVPNSGTNEVKAANGQ